jgi:vacuolar iron transporter family protein
MIYKHKELEIGGISFGATSAVITTLGIIIGLGTAVDSRLAMATSVVVLAFCDSLADALGMQLSEQSRQDEKGKPIILESIFTFIGRFLFSLIFLIPIALLNLKWAEIVSVIIGVFVITVFSVIIAKRKKISVLKEVIENVALTIIVVIVSYFLGHLAHQF